MICNDRGYTTFGAIPARSLTSPRDIHALDRPSVSRFILALWLDASLSTVAYVIAWTVRFGAELPVFMLYARRALLPFVVGQLLGALALGGYRRASIATTWRFAIGATIGLAGGIAYSYLQFGPDGLSRAALMAGSGLSVLLGVAWRLGGHLLRRRTGFGRRVD